MKNKDKKNEQGQPKVLCTKKYSIEVEYLENDTLRVNRINDGFYAYELLGILFKTQQDILEQIAGNIKPSIVERGVIKK